MVAAAFRRLCVETETGLSAVSAWKKAAAFRRLCVETMSVNGSEFLSLQPPSGGCVLKPLRKQVATGKVGQPPSGGCVLKQHIYRIVKEVGSSRLQAAVC